MVEKSECPLCKTPISKERFERVTGIWKTIKNQEEEFKKKTKDLEQQKKKVLEQIKKNEEKWKKEKQDIQKKWNREKEELKKKIEQEALKKVSAKHKKEILEIGKKANEEGRKKQKLIDEQHRRKEIKLRNQVRNMEKKLEEARKKGLTEQGMGFDYEEILLKELRENFKGDNIEKKGKRGDILHIIIYKEKEISRILYECKRKNTWKEEDILTLKEAVLSREVNLGILVTSKFKKGKKGFFIAGENIFVVSPEAIIDFVKVWRSGIIKINSLKITEDEKNILMKHLWGYVDSNEFKSVINDIVDKSKELQDALKREAKQHEKIWRTRLRYYKQIGEGSLGIKEKIEGIVQEKKKSVVIKVSKKRKQKDT